MAYTARLTKQQLRQRRDATRDRSRDNTKGTVQYLVTYAYTNNNCLLCASNNCICRYSNTPTRQLLLVISIQTNLVTYVKQLVSCKWLSHNHKTPTPCIYCSFEWSKFSSPCLVSIEC